MVAYSQLECERNLTDNTVLSDTSLRHFFPPQFLVDVTVHWVFLYLSSPEIHLSVCQCVLTPAGLSTPPSLVAFICRYFTKKPIFLYKVATPLFSQTHTQTKHAVT